MEKELTVTFRSLRPMATGLDVLGDKWSLLIMRDMLFGFKTLFNEFKESPEAIPSKNAFQSLEKIGSLGFF